MNRRTFVTSGLAVTLMAGAGFAATSTDLLASRGDEGSETVDASRSTLTTATVVRGDLSAEREFKATVSFGDTWTVTTAAVGTITQQHPVGTIVGFGDTLLRLDDKPVFLAQGAMPMYRELNKVDTTVRDENGTRLKQLSGFDVTQLQTFLVEAGFDADGKLEADGLFGGYTEQAVKAWQEAVGLPATGRINDSQIVFATGPVRIAAESRVGAAFAGLEVSNAEPAVLVDTSNRDRAALTVDGDVEVELPDGTMLAGTVTDQKQVTAQDGSVVWRTTITASSELPGEASTATVTVTEILAEDVLLVPVGALLALAEGGFAVEVQTGTGTTLVGAEVGEILDGQASINGNIDEGTEVVVAT